MPAINLMSAAKWLLGRLRSGSTTTLTMGHSPVNNSVITGQVGGNVSVQMVSAPPDPFAGLPWFDRPGAPEFHLSPELDNGPSAIGPPPRLLLGDIAVTGGPPGSPIATV